MKAWNGRGSGVDPAVNSTDTPAVEVYLKARYNGDQE